ncbi:MAG: copper resistance system multicopper oxidase [Alphaproteobacteria bacterium]|nr:copper resistance system multicopper oxidase [Alphaproteobacteria bacterium]
MKPFALFLCAVILFSSSAEAGTYHLDIERKAVNITGSPVEKITVNGGIPGPTLRFREGEDVTITVTNHLDEDTSVHWHGLLLPGEMDGVPGFNAFPGIKPGETFTYHFRIRQSGTYWYHAHSMGQEQDGHYGSIVITPRDKDPLQANRDYVVLISDFHEGDWQEILANLKKDSDYYQFNRRTLGDFFNDIDKKGFATAWNFAADWGEMRMRPTDLSDVTGYIFLINGKTPEQNWTGLFKPGERVRLRFINASAMSFYDVRIPGLKMQVVSSDGQDIEPVPVDEFRFGVAETYDVIVTPKEDKAYTIVAEPIDRTGFALGTLATREEMIGEKPQPRPRTLLNMVDMGMNHAAMEHHEHGGTMSMEQIAEVSGWANAGTPAGSKALNYADLRFFGIQKDTRLPQREILVRLGGNMERYIWTINGKKFEDSGPISLNYGERVRLKFVNDTMMAHPMHLHGMFVQLENGQPAGKLPNKHTIIIPPGQSYSALLTADEPGEWAFHCHLLYHMMTGMMNKVVVAKLDPTATAPLPSSDLHKESGTSPSHEEGHHHAH